MEWLFDGLGTQIIILIITNLLTLTGGYVWGSKRSYKQNQKAENVGMMYQSVADKAESDDISTQHRRKRNKSNLSMHQVQKAKNVDNQIQMGSINDEQTNSKRRE